VEDFRNFESAYRHFRAELAVDNHSIRFKVPITVWWLLDMGVLELSEISIGSYMHAFAPAKTINARSANGPTQRHGTGAI